MTEIQKSVTLTGLTIAITSVFMIILGNNVFAIEYSIYTNNKYGIEFDYPKILSLDSINPSFEQRDNYIIIPIGGNFKDSNQQKLTSCAQSYMTMIPKIHRDDKSYWDGSIVACAYGMYNYNINIGDKYNVDRFDVQMIEIEVQGCMSDDHCMKKISQIIKGKIALPHSSTPTFKDSSPSTPPKFPSEELPEPSLQEQEEWLIEFCSKRLFDSNHLPPYCEDPKFPNLQEKIQDELKKLKQNEVQKFKENNGN